MAHARIRLFRWLSVIVALAPHPALAQISPLHAYFGVNRPVPCRIELPDDTPRTNAVEVALIEPVTGELVDRAPLTRGDAGTPPDVIDLAQTLPVIWTERHHRLLYAQLIVGGKSTGAPLVLEPLVTPRRFRDALSERVLEAFRRRDATELTRLLAMSESAKAAMRTDVRERPAQYDPVFSGLRAYPLRDVVLQTSDGDMRVKLEPDAAPRTVFRFLQLVDDGFYEQIAFHRVINADAEGLPFIVQCGDPTGTGFGGCGDLGDFEPSTLAHERGVLSMARRSDDPNSNGSQFFICLGREACAKLDGRFTAFARVVDGFDVLDAIATTPVAPPEENEGEGIPQRPIHPPILEHARSVPAPPISIHTTPKPKPKGEAPVVR